MFQSMPTDVNLTNTLLDNTVDNSPEHFMWNENGLVIIYNSVGYCLVHQTGQIYATSLNLEELDPPEAHSSHETTYLLEARFWNSGVMHLPVEELIRLEQSLEWNHSVSQALAKLG